MTLVKFIGAIIAPAPRLLFDELLSGGQTRQHRRYDTHCRIFVAAMGGVFIFQNVVEALRSYGVLAAR